MNACGAEDIKIIFLITTASPPSSRSAASSPLRACNPTLQRLGALRVWTLVRAGRSAIQPDLPGHKLEPIKSLRVLGRRRDVGMAFAAKARIAGLHGEEIMVFSMYPSSGAAYMEEQFSLRAGAITKHIRPSRKEGLSMDDEKVTMQDGD